MLLRALAPILFLIILFSPATSDAQQDAKVYRVGFILTTSPVSEMVGRQPKHTGINMFLRELELLGYIEGRNLVLERRSAEGKAERYGDIVADLVRVNMDVIVTLGNSMTQRAKEVTTTVPIVMILGVDPVRAGIVQSVAHPGGNVTGFSIEAGAELYAKRLALLKEAAPKVARVAFLGSTEDWEGTEGRSVRAAAEQLRLDIFRAEATENDFGVAFAEIERGRANAVFVASSAPHFVHRERIVDFVTRKRLPNTHHYRSSVEVGGLMSYGADTSEHFRRSAGYVNKILRGAKPGDLPIEQPTKFELVININAAKKLGLTIPSSLLLQADRVIK